MGSRRWSADDWKRWDAERCVGAGSAGGRASPGAPVAEAGGDAAVKKRGGRHRRGGHSSEWFAKQLASVQRDNADLRRKLEKQEERGRAEGRATAEAERIRDPTPRSSTGGDAAAADGPAADGPRSDAADSSEALTPAQWRAARDKVDTALRAARETKCQAAVAALEEKR